MGRSCKKDSSVAQILCIYSYDGAVWDVLINYTVLLLVLFAWWRGASFDGCQGALLLTCFLLLVGCQLALCLMDGGMGIGFLWNAAFAFPALDPILAMRFCSMLTESGSLSVAYVAVLVADMYYYYFGSLYITATHLFGLLVGVFLRLALSCLTSKFPSLAKTFWEEPRSETGYGSTA
uniref:Uncharacterized protein n=1 Tax=Zooxanthella nutricula TaxID=1333877 RepID=A0A6U8TVC7_9DINO|mmetsp:Transcript_81866/g.250166  ORF Transcript_81866/g.250166 Transcript_81866/m.250166 type:complete len:178 (+) Transcript_81866:49-582(+)